MPITTTTHLANLKRTLLKLSPVGSDGFEGLLAAVLTMACGQPFRLASSGTQRGRDGDTAFDAGATYFEAKRYGDKVPKKEISVKLMDLVADDQGQVDTWIIGATSPIPALNAKDFRSFAESVGIGIVLLDWTDNTPLPPLATMIVMGGQAAKDFFRSHLNEPTDENLLSDALTAIDHLALLPEFATQSNTLRQEIKNPSVGLGLAKAANQSWFRKVFSCQALARQQFGQPLAPDDSTMDFLQPRTSLRDSLSPAFIGTPSGNVLSVIGPEGAGKSWLLANTWMQTDPASILLIAPAGELQNPEDITRFEDFLIRKLIEQTGSDITEANQKRWKRRFAGWKANPDPPNVRITLCIDGLNQNPRYPWPRWIDGASYFLRKLGGHLVVTTRTTHFPAIRQSTTEPITRIVVPEWNERELEAILRTRTINPDVLDNEVFETLKNPRILSIAVNLIDARDIEKMEQLSVGRLLFEHLRTSNLSGSTDLLPPEFARALRDVASEYLSRLHAGAQDDLTLFDTRDHSRLSDVSSGRFFRPVGNDPDRYQIVEEGLHLALGIWLVDALEKEHRNQRDPFTQLEVVLEPVTGLDITASIVGSATEVACLKDSCQVEVACLKDSCQVEVASALIRHYVGLQNLPEERRESFGALVKKHPEAFVKAAEDAALGEGNSSTSDWLNVAILKAREHEGVKNELKRNIPEWLSYYSLAPERMMYASIGNESAEKIQAERQTVSNSLEEKLQNLTDAEQNYIRTNLKELDSGDLDRLHRLAFFLLAGLPLEQFAGSLFSFALSGSLTQTIHAPRAEFEHLMRFNYVDWNATRAALVEWIGNLGETRSSVGDWAVIKALRATGDQSDAAEAEQLTKVLTKDREHVPSWRLVENYCATDPCDPDARRPDNIADTAMRYRSMPVDQLCLTMGNSQETLFFDMAQPGVARFEPEAGAHAIRRLSCHTLTRLGLPRRQALHALLSNSVLLERTVVDALVSRTHSETNDEADQSDSQNEWFTALFSMFIAIPHLNGDEQLRALDDIQATSILPNLTDTLKPAKASVVECLLERALTENGSHCLTSLLTATNHAESPLTPRAVSIIADLLASPQKGVRAEALGIASSTENELLLKRLSDSDWDAARLAPNDDYFELWHGSAALIASVSAGILEQGEALDRMAASHYGFAAERLGTSAASMVADRVGVALMRVLSLGELSGVPEIEHAIPHSASSLPPLIVLREEASLTSTRAALHHFPDTEEQFQERQRRLRRAYQRLSKELTNADARLVLTDLTATGMAAILAARPDLISVWYALLFDAGKATKKNLHMFALQFAGAIAEGHHELAVSLFRAYSSVVPLVRQVVGMANTPMEAEVLWSHANIPQIAEECTKRLDDCTSDYEIAIEVLAAFKYEKEHILKCYVEQLLATAEPVNMARALTVSGFSDDSEFAGDTLSRFNDAKGFIGEAYRAARAAYDRNKWSRYWYGFLQSATTPLDFWRYSVLLSKIVDGRFDLWGPARPAEGLFNAFIPTIEGEIKQRVKKWNKKRKETLFGNKVPHMVFLFRDFSID